MVPLGFGLGHPLVWATPPFGLPSANQLDEGPDFFPKRQSKGSARKDQLMTTRQKTHMAITHEGCGAGPY